MFEQLRRSLEDMLQRATKPEERRTVMARMRSTLVQARMGVDDLRDALSYTKRKLESEQRELETVRRRKTLAAGIRDEETIKIAERFERQHEERIRVLTEKVAVQTRELELADRELEEMKAELRKAMIAAPGSPSGGAPGGAPLEDPLEDPADRQMRDELDSLLRERARSERDAEADRRLDELKKKMGR